MDQHGSLVFFVLFFESGRKRHENSGKAKVGLTFPVRSMLLLMLSAVREGAPGRDPASDMAAVGTLVDIQNIKKSHARTLQILPLCTQCCPTDSGGKGANSAASLPRQLIDAASPLRELVAFVW